MLGNIDRFIACISQTIFHRHHDINNSIQSALIIIYDRAWKKNYSAINLKAYRVHLDITENWKHCSKIIFKCVNSAMRPIFNESFTEKRGLWVPWTVHRTHWKSMKHSSQKKKKKRMKCRRWTQTLYPNGYIVQKLFQNS